MSWAERLEREPATEAFGGVSTRRLTLPMNGSFQHTARRVRIIRCVRAPRNAPSVFQESAA